MARLGKLAEIKENADRVLGESRDEPRLIWIDRPKLIHDRIPEMKALVESIDPDDFFDLTKPTPEQPDLSHHPKCACGCGSRIATVIEERPHLSILIDRIDGTKRIRSHLKTDEDRAAFDELTTRAKRIHMPLRCYPKQLAILEANAKVKGAFGGVRGGKTTIESEDLTDEVLEFGGPQVQVWVVAPTRDKTRIVLRKLVEGETTGKGANRKKSPPILPPELVVSYPLSVRSDHQYIQLIDGSRIHLKYGSSDGGNLKGDPPNLIIADELCEIDHESNYQQFMDRLLESNGRFIFATTPVAGHWAEQLLFRNAVEIAEWDGEYAKRIYTTLTCIDNPWVNPWYVRDTAEVKDNKKNVRRELGGEWISDGDLLWTEYKSEIHLYRGGGRDCEDYGLVNITEQVARKFFRGAKGRLRTIGGMDFNFWPMSVVLFQIAVPKGMDESNPDNWIMFVVDEVIQRAENIIQFARFLAEEAGSQNGRGLKRDAFAGMHIACDPSGAMPDNWRAAQHGMAKGSTLAKEMERFGFDCRPANGISKGKAQWIPRVDSISMMHRLMSDRVKLPEGTTLFGGRTELPRLMIHLDRCPILIDAIETQEKTEDGTMKKEKGVHDRRSGPTDGLRYGAYPIFYKPTYVRPQPEISYG